jgi:hypothetical protein
MGKNRNGINNREANVIANICSKSVSMVGPFSKIATPHTGALNK